MTNMLSNKQKVLLDTFGLLNWALETKPSKVYKMLNWIDKKNPNTKQMEEVKKKLGI